MNLEKLETEIAKENEGFCGEVRGMTLSQVKDTLARLSMDIQAVDQAKENDEELADLKGQVKEIEAPYRESKKKLQKKVKFVVAMLEEKNIEGA